MDMSEKTMSMLMVCVRIFPSISTPKEALPWVKTFFRMTVKGPDRVDNKALSE